MINQQIHRKVEAVDSAAHRQTRLVLDSGDWSFCSALNSVFLTATEFGDACREYPVVFIDAGKDESGKALVAPVAVLGMTQNENLFVDGKRWRGHYVPALLRSYPFCSARIDNDRFAVCFDGAYAGVSSTEGERLFGDDGQPAPLLVKAQQQLELLESEIQRTRVLCGKLLEADVLRDMRFDATLPDGRKHSVDGFFAVDQERLAALSDEKVLDLHKSGALGLVHAHWISLGNMRLLLESHLQRHPAAPATPAANA